jgi:hypothetical protein
MDGCNPICNSFYISYCRGHCFLTPLLEQAFSLSLLVITEQHNWAYLGASGDSEKTQDRQTDRKWSQVCWPLEWRCPTLIASFLYLYSLRSYSLQFFYFNLFFTFYFIHMWIMFGSFIPLSPHSLPYLPLPLTTWQKKNYSALISNFVEERV